MNKPTEKGTSGNDSGSGKDCERVTITIDGRQIETEAGLNIVKVASEKGIFIPSIC